MKSNCKGLSGWIVTPLISDGINAGVGITMVPGTGKLRMLSGIAAETKDAGATTFRVNARAITVDNILWGIDFLLCWKYVMGVLL